MVKQRKDKLPKATMTSAHVFEAHKLKRLAGGEEKPLSPADLITHAPADPVVQMPKKQSRKDKEDEKLAMEVKGVKDAEKKARKPRAKKEEKKEEVISHAVEEAKVVQAAEQKAIKAVRKGRFEKGSEAAKEHMARIRAMRKKKEAK